MQKSIIRYYQRKVRKLKTIVLNNVVIKYRINPSLRYITADIYQRKPATRGTGIWLSGTKEATIEALGPKALALKIGRQLSNGKLKNDTLQEIPDPMYRDEYNFWFK